jgi:hypothetical protein
MMSNRLVFVFAMSVALLVSVPLNAHHTGSTLLSEKTVTLKGTVQSWLWSNPHCLLKLAVTGADGQVVEWTMETQAPNSIYPDGYRKNSFKPGDEVTITLQPAANGGPYGRIAYAVLADGTTLGNLPGQGGRGRGAAAQ